MNQNYSRTRWMAAPSSMSERCCDNAIGIVATLIVGQPLRRRRDELGIRRDMRCKAVERESDDPIADSNIRYVRSALDNPSDTLDTKRSSTSVIARDRFPRPDMTFMKLRPVRRLASISTS